MEAWIHTPLSTPFKAVSYTHLELETACGVNWYDYGARRYDPVLGRWNGVDPSCEKHYSWSPYVYCKNNPVLRIDPVSYTHLDVYKRQSLKGVLSGVCIHASIDTT